MIAIKYTIFALLSIVVNLFVQYLSFYFYSGFLSLYIALIFGTLAGLLVKFILDKNYIFYHKTKDLKDSGKKFFLYSFMGVFTTIIFWGFEIGFDLLFKDLNAKYIGGFIGLVIGYITKYKLDKKYVFKEKDDFK